MPAPPDNPTVAFVSLGCVKNLVDSEKMLGVLAEDGMVPALNPENADVLVVNTCGFIDESKRESLATIREALAWKNAAPGRRVVVAGCLAQRYGEQIAAELPGIDAMVGVFEREKIAEACRSAPAESDVESPREKVGGRRLIPLPMRGNAEARSAGREAHPTAADAYEHWQTHSSAIAGAKAPLTLERRGQAASLDPSPQRGEGALSTPPSPARRTDRAAAGFWLGGDVTRTGLDLARVRLTPRHYAYLRISEGCDKRCSFCIIPHIRGDLVCKRPDEVLTEARELVADGAEELIVVGQNTTSYGKDIDYPDGIAGLLRRLARETDARRLRLMYVYPANFYTNLIDAMADEGKILPYVDMPLQHIDDRMLKRMKRGVSRARIEDLLTRIRKRVAGVVIRTTFIVGFPGETDAEFGQTVKFVRDFGIERVGVFTYSPEEGTPARDLPGAIPDDVKRARREALMLAAQEVAFRHVRGLVGKTLAVTLDARAEEPPPASPAARKTKKKNDTRATKPEAWWVGRYYGQAPEVDSVVYVRQNGRRLAPGKTLDCKITAGSGYDLLSF
jgi:ribosomal protein S12 methylthiotransferase